MTGDTVEISKSRYLRIFETAGDGRALAWHSLFGNPVLLSPHTHQILLHGRCADLSPATKAVLHDLFFLVEKNEDERTLVERELVARHDSIRGGGRLRALQLNVCESCNLGCAYCFADRVDETSLPIIRSTRARGRMMSVGAASDAIDAAARVLERHGTPALVVKFFGREPLLNWPTIDAILAKYAPLTSPISYRFAITTNATGIQEDIARRFHDCSVQVVVSLDGLQDANTQRTLPTGEGSFERVDLALTCLQHAGVKTAIACVLSPANFESLGDDFLGYLESRSIHEVEIRVAMQNEYGAGFADATWTNKLVQLHRSGRQRGILVTGDWYHPFSGLLQTMRRRGHATTTRLAPPACSASEHQLSVEPNGEIFPCRAMRRPLAMSGGIDVAVQTDEYVDLVMRTYGSVDSCKGCDLEGLCQGVCLGHVEERLGTIYGRDETFCKIYRDAFSLLVQDYLECLV
jgi:uncharacterized protein